MLKEILTKVMSRETLSSQDSYQAMRSILEGEGTPSQISSFISLLTFRGVETEELIGLTQAMRNFAQPLPIDQAFTTPIVDTCGTGGAGIKTFNVSTASAVVASASGMKIAKHGNRAVTSLSGSADVLQELGLDVDLSPEEMVHRLKKYHMCFMFAPMYHQAMKHAANTRKEIGFRSVFNLLGPLTNPAGALHQVIGVFDSQYSLKMAETLKELGSKHVLIVASKDGLDEFSVGAETFVTELKNGDITQYFISPEDVGLTLINNLKEIQVRTPQESAKIIMDVLQGQDKGIAYEMICYNAGAALYVGEKANTLQEGVRLAKQLIDSRTALEHYLSMSSRKEVVRHA
jgi:anthranilate phosphoribosyltransferase